MAEESVTLRTTGATVGRVVVVKGSVMTYTITLAGAGSIAGATVVANIRRRGSPTTLVADASLTLTDAANRIVTLALSESDTANLIGNLSDPVTGVEHVLDVGVTLAGDLTTYGPLVFNVRAPAKVS